MSTNSALRVMFMIVNMGFADEIVDVVREVGVRGATIIHAQGAGAPIGTIMGIAVDPQKEIILAVVDEATAEKAMAEIKEKAGRDTPARCVCFTMPVDKTIGLGGI